MYPQNEKAYQHSVAAATACATQQSGWSSGQPRFDSPAHTVLGAAKEDMLRHLETIYTITNMISGICDRALGFEPEPAPGNPTNGSGSIPNGLLQELGSLSQQTDAVLKRLQNASDRLSKIA